MTLQTRISDLVARPLFWVLLVGAIASYPIARAMTRDVPPPPPVLGEVPAFRLIDQAGRELAAEDLRGRVWVANFIFTRCPDVCPTFTAKMAELQRRARPVGNAVHLVSFSVDPEYDTPERLAAYARAHGADARRWSFVTGASEDVRRAVVEGMKIAVERAPDGGWQSILHGTHFVIVDARGRIRAYHDMNEPGAVDRVIRDLGILVNRPD